MESLSSTSPIVITAHEQSVTSHSTYSGSTSELSVSHGALLEGSESREIQLVDPQNLIKPMEDDDDFYLLACGIETSSFNQWAIDELKENHAKLMDEYGDCLDDLLAGSYVNSEVIYQPIAKMIYDHAQVCDGSLSTLGCVLTNHNSWHATKTTYGIYRTSSWQKPQCEKCGYEDIFTEESDYKNKLSSDNAKKFLNNLAELMHDTTKNSEQKVDMMKALLPLGKETSWQELFTKTCSSMGSSSQQTEAHAEAATSEDVEMVASSKRKSEAEYSEAEAVKRSKYSNE